MDPAVFAQCLILTGSTASGKSTVGLVLAERLNAEIVAMDSMTLYRGMDVGTAKPTPAERARVPHHLVDVLDPGESANVAWWLREAARITADVQRRGKRVLFVGGTPLYLKALLRGLFEGPPANADVRASLEAETAATLHDRLVQVDPVAARRIHPNDHRRLVRALEVATLEGIPISERQAQFQHQHPRAFTPIWLDLPREVLYERINQRVEHMLANGLMEEVTALASRPQELGLQARQALGYKELLDHLAGQGTLGETIELIKTRSRNFAKRQLTWFRHLPECHRLSINPSEGTEEIVARILAHWGLETSAS